MNKVIASENGNHFNNKKKLESLRIVDRNLLFVKGFPKEIVHMKALLNSRLFFANYGKILSMVFMNELNKKKLEKISVFVKYENEMSVLIAILAINKSYFNKYQLNASYGKTRLCFNFIND